MPNIRFNYRYRDGANYKRFSSVVFTNADNLELGEIEKLITAKLISETWFYAHEWNVPEIFLKSFDWKVDPTWHEFEGLEYTEEVASAELADLLRVIG